MKSFLVFVLAGLCEIGGGYALWQSIRERRGIHFALAGAALLVLYGIVATRQPATFGRTYAAYGGVFIAMSVFWGWMIDRIVPDRFDIIGAGVCLIGMAIIMYAPRG